MTLSIAHMEREIVMLDVVREVRPPFSPESVVASFAATLKPYRITTIRGDRYAGEWPREQFRKLDIGYDPSERNRSEICGELLPLINSRRVDLLDDKRTIAQLVQLERRTSRIGRGAISYPRGAAVGAGLSSFQLYPSDLKVR